MSCTPGPLDIAAARELAMSGAKDERARAEATPTAVFPDLDAAPSESSSACMAALSSKSHPSSQPSHESSIASPLSPSDSIRASGKRDKLALSLHDSIIRGGLLRDSIFPEWKDGGPRSNMESPDEMMKKDPLATQIWKLYSRTKFQLPNQERMENLTWRMMAMSLKRNQREQQARYVSSPAPLPGSTLAVSCYLSLISLSLSLSSSSCSCIHAGTGLADKIPFFSLASQKKDNDDKNNNSTNNTSPSGISQLRKSVDQSATSTASAADSMNLDDFIIPSSIGSPAGIPTSPPAEPASTSASGNAVTSAIPIKGRKDQQAPSHGNIAPASFPHPSQDQRKNGEFGYVQRRVRKTSVDERKVAAATLYCAV